MDPLGLAILEGLLFFIIFAVTFKALMNVDITKAFQKGAIRDIQIIYIFLALALSYLVLKAIMNLVTISITIFG
ncbi:MAG: DUF1146 family protein [Bacillota bacterium]